MSKLIVLAATLLALAVELAAAGGSAQANTATTQLFLQNLAGGTLTSPGLCGNLVAPNVTLAIHGDPALIPLAGTWGGTSCLGLQRYTTAASRYTKFVGWGVVVNAADSQYSYASGHVTAQVVSTGLAVHNMSVALWFTFDRNANVSAVDLYFDTSALAQATCKSGALVCAATAAEHEALMAASTSTGPLGFMHGGSQVLDHEMGRMETSNMATLQAYWGAIFQGNLAGASTHLDPSVVTTWHGQQNIVPIAGTWTGRNGWIKFLSGAVSSVANFTLIEFSFAACQGVYCIATWKEHSYTVTTGRPVDGLVNFGVYTFSPQSLITKVDVYLDSLAYGVRFCASNLACT